MNAPTHTLLIADDDARGMAYLQGLLSSEGYRLITAGDGASALEKAERDQPDAILLDVMMPGMDGFEACRRIRSHPRLSQVPVILLTALDDRESKLTGLEAGADDFLSKPFDSAELLAKLRTISRLNRFRRLSEEHERFKRVVSLAPDAIVILTQEGRILLSNREFARLSGLQDAESAAGRTLSDWVDDADWKRLAVVLAGASAELPGGRALEVTMRAAGAGAEHGTPVEVTAGLLPWEDGQAVQLNLRDVSERKRLETQVLQFQRIELLGELAGGVVHDMNNVLGAVMGSLEVLCIEMGPNPIVAKRADVMKNSLIRGRGILRQLLAFTRGADESMVPLEIQPIAREVHDLLHTSFRYTHEIELDFPQSLPRIRGDSSQLHQILMNLCVNARDAMAGGGKLTVSGRVADVDGSVAGRQWGEVRRGRYVVLSVSDAGSGMPPEVQARVFTPFFTTKPKGKGTGLGLATVLRLVTRHGGFVALESEEGRGTAIRCHFPAIAAEEQPGAGR